MNIPIQPRVPNEERSLPFECVALVLQGGGALGAYQAGVCEALAEAGIQPDWLAGISIGAINAVIVAGNPPKKRVERLHEFWTEVTAEGVTPSARKADLSISSGNTVRRAFNMLSAGRTLLHGSRGFFSARPFAPWLEPPGTSAATSFYDTSALRRTLERLTDFDRVNAGLTRLSVGAVNVRTGNFVCFDTTTHSIRAEHIIASAALPPAFPAIEIDGEYYWDGGIVSNTPLQWIVNSQPRRDTLAFQVDLWSEQGEVPSDMFEVITREKEIRYSSRTRANTDQFKQNQSLRRAVADLIERLPVELRDIPQTKLLDTVADRKVYNIVQLIYRAKAYEGHSKDYEFSRTSMEEHWRAGHNDAVRTLRHSEVLARPTDNNGVLTFDLAVNGRE
ncbi:MAG TPA: patatin-like phospholipase family protein [Rhizomicrobium sp.]|nr:patatin-like phospholipase family protein [Rhizomicrobium sp.]